MEVIAVNKVIHGAFVGPDRVCLIRGLLGLLLDIPPPLPGGKPGDIDMCAHRIKPRVGFSEDVGFLRPRAVIGYVMGDKEAILTTQGHEHRLIGDLGVYKTRMHPDVIGLISHGRGEDWMSEVAPFHEGLTVKDTDAFFDAIDNLRRAIEWVLNPSSSGLGNNW